MGRLISCWTLLLAVVAITMSRLCAAENTGFKLQYGYAVYGYANNMRFSRPSGLFYDVNRDEVSVADTGNGQIVIIDGKGIPTTRFPHTVVDSTTGDRRPGEPRGIVVRKNGEMLVTDNLCNYIDVLNYQGRSVEKIWPGDLLDLPRVKVQPRCLAIDAADNVYVSVNGEVNGILVLSPNLTLKIVIDRIGAGGGFKAITGLWVDKDGKIYTTYAQGECVKIFSSDGQMLTSFGEHEAGPQNFSLPSGVVTDVKSNIWVVDNLRHVLTIFSHRTTDKPSFLKNIGGFGEKPGELAYPTAVAGDGVNKIFMLENLGSRLQAITVKYAD